MTPGERLAKAVRDRRLALGDLTQAQVAERGGPSTETLRLIENARQPRFGDRTLLRLDRALDWPDGTAAKVLDGTATQEDLEEVVLRDEKVQRSLGLPRDAITGAGHIAYAGTAHGIGQVDDPRATVVTVTEMVARLAAESDRNPDAADALGRLRRILPELWGDDPKGSE